MTWHTTDWANADWASLDNLNDFIAALAERGTACGEEGAPFVTEGDDVQGTYFWGELDPFHTLTALQGRVVLFHDHFIQSHDLDGTPRGAGYYDGYAGSLPAWTWENVCKAAGIWKDATHYGFRRVAGPDLPADWTDVNDPAYSFGYMQAGDIIGPWIMRDLQALLNLLVWTSGTTEWLGGGYAGGATAGTIAAAKAAAEADWHVDSDPIPDPAWAQSIVYAQGANWVAGLSRRAPTSRWLYVPNHRKSAIEFYLTPIKWPTDWPYPSTTFDGNGDVGEENKLSLASTETNDDGDGDPEIVEITTTAFDASVKPNWCADEESSRGYLTHALATPPFTTPCLIRWNVAGGFAYV